MRKIIDTTRAHRLSYREAAKKHGIPSHTPIMKWEQTYLEEGSAGLYTDRRGRKSTGRPVKELSPKIQEDLIAENQRLRAEIDYLKKLNALVSEEERQNKRRK